MAFTIHDFADLRRLLQERPEWRAELRELILTDELMALPRAFAETRIAYEARFERIEHALEELTQRVDVLTQRMDALTQRVDVLTQRMDALTQRVDALTQRVDALTQRVDALTQRVDDLAEAQARTESSLQKLIERVDKLADKQGQMLGKLLERDYADHAQAYFTDYLKRVRVVSPAPAFDDLTEEILYERLSAAQRRQVARLDIILRAKLIAAPGPDSPDIWVAIEVSAVIDRNDVERVQERAAILRQAGLRVVAVVAGQDITRGAAEMLEHAPVLLLIDGKSEGWERALDVAMRD